VKAAVLELEVLSHNMDTGDVLCMNRITVFLRGAGGFSTSSPPFSYSERKSQLNLTPLSKPSIPAQELPPDIVIEEQTHPSQVCILKPN
jgi:peroxisomal enoyl-CoA hydratase 2